MISGVVPLLAIISATYRVGSVDVNVMVLIPISPWCGAATLPHQLKKRRRPSEVEKAAGAPVMQGPAGNYDTGPLQCSSLLVRSPTSFVVLLHIMRDLARQQKRGPGYLTFSHDIPNCHLPIFHLLSDESTFRARDSAFRRQS
jgi:hypothetical protein